jgi:pteridine reductase
VHYRGSRAGAEDVVASLAASGRKAHAFAADLSRPDAPAKLLSDVLRYFGSLEILVNSAATMERTPFAGIDANQWDRIMAINMRAPFLMALEFSRQSGTGVIVNIADVAAFETWPEYVVHGLSKAGVVAMTRSLARMLAPGVRVNAVAPGAVLLPEGWPEENARQIERTTPLKRIGVPDDVAEAVLFLVRSSFTTGQTLVVDGGRMVRH